MLKIWLINSFKKFQTFNFTLSCFLFLKNNNLLFKIISLHHSNSTLFFQRISCFSWIMSLFILFAGRHRWSQIVSSRNSNLQSTTTKGTKRGCSEWHELIWKIVFIPFYCWFHVFSIGLCLFWGEMDVLKLEFWR